MTKRYAAALASAALLALPVATPTFAQGAQSPMVKDGTCPSGWSVGGPSLRGKPNPNMCYPRTSDAPLAYPNPSRSSCADGYSRSSGYCVVSGGYSGPSAADQLVSYGTITKASRADRCPLGYFSKGDMTVCTTRLSPAPKSRRKAGACRANEIDEWGLYCTADAKVITREQAEQEATRDFNAIYTANGANYPAQGSDTENYPSMVAAYGPKGSGGSASASSSSSGSTASPPATNSNCTTDTSSAGAALGGQLGGQMGAALGGIMGGMAKKKPGC